jgi:hypothetical protein
VWGIVFVSNGFGADDSVLFFVEGYIDGVVDRLLPIVRTGLTVCSAVAIGGWEDFFELAKFVFLTVFTVWEWLREEGSV